MAHPYRTRPTLPPGEPDNESRLAGPTLAFGFLCVVSGIALAGPSRSAAALLAGGAGSVAIATRRPRRAEARRKEERRSTGTDGAPD